MPYVCAGAASRSACSLVTRQCALPRPGFATPPCPGVLCFFCSSPASRLFSPFFSSQRGERFFFRVLCVCVCCAASLPLGTLAGSHCSCAHQRQESRRIICHRAGLVLPSGRITSSICCMYASGRPPFPQWFYSSAAGQDTPAGEPALQFPFPGSYEYTSTFSMTIV